MTRHSRRSFLMGKVSQPEPHLIVPPGARPGFAELCKECGDCALACPAGIIIQHSSGKPVLDFSKGACSFCSKCSEACETGALAVQDKTNWPWRATITENCFSLTGISCRACEDACEPRAIRFRLMPGGIAKPVLAQDKCTGCGECAFTCPAGAVEFQAMDTIQEVAQ